MSSSGARSTDTRKELKRALHQFKNEGGFVYSTQHKDADQLVDALEAHIRSVVMDAVIAATRTGRR